MPLKNSRGSKFLYRLLKALAPEEGEKAEPIAMGRQTLWGGAGKPPSREVMQAAARAARQEMMQRIRDQRKAGGGKDRRPHGASGAALPEGGAQTEGEELRPTDADAARIRSTPTNIGQAPIIRQ